MGSGRSHRRVVRLLEGIGVRLWGFPPRLMEHVVTLLGPAQALWWFVRNMPRYERTLSVLGPVRTHLVAMTVSLLNGCRYCAYGHAYALELVHYRATGVLFPVDARTLAGWTGLPAAELRSRLRSVLQEADLHVDVLWMDKALDIADGARPMDRDELRIEHLVRMFRLLNTAGIAGDVEPDEAHDPINKDVELKRRMARERDPRAS